MAHIDESTGLVLDGLDDLTQKAKATIRVTIPEADLSSQSDYDNLGNLFAADAFQHQQPIAYTAQQIYPETAETPYLERHGEVLRIPRKGPSAASGYALLTGTATSTQGNSSALTSSSGVALVTTTVATLFTPGWSAKTVISYDVAYPDRVVLSAVTGMAVNDPLVSGGVTYVIRDLPGAGAVLIYGSFAAPPQISAQVTPGTGYAVPILASVEGAAGNLLPGDTLTLSSPGAGVNAQATVLILSGGLDRATNQRYALDLQAVRSEHPAGDNRSHVLLWSMGYETDGATVAVLGVDDAFVYPTRRGPGTTDVISRGIKRARHLSSAKRTELQTYVNPAVPSLAHPGKVGPGNDLLFTDFTDLLVDVYLVLTPALGYGPDWVGLFTVDVGSNTSRINTIQSPLGRLAVGSRVVIQTGPDPGNLEQRHVDRLDGAGFSVDLPFSYVPPVNRTIYPGGPLIEPVRDAVRDLFDLVGPGDTSPPSRYPPSSVTAPSDLPLALLSARVMGVAGMHNLTIQQPASDVAAVFPQQPVLHSLIITHG